MDDVDQNDNEENEDKELLFERLFPYLAIGEPGAEESGME